MRISFLKIVIILFSAVALALIFNYLQPDGIPLFNKNNYETVHVDENLYPPPTKDNRSEPEIGDTAKHDFNKMAVEKNRVEIDDNILPSYDYKSDSDLGNGKKSELPETGSDNEDINLSNLTKAVFNQPRLISLTQAYELYRDKIVFVDARDPEEFKDGHIAGAINLPLFSIDDFIDKLSGIDKDKPLVTYCEGADCDMSIRLGNELYSRGYKKVFVFFGGWEEWTDAHYPVVTSSTNLQLN